MKRVGIAIVVVFAALLGVIGWQVVKPSDEPVYKGRTLTSWLKDYMQVMLRPPPAGARVFVTLQLNPESQEAIRQIGTNAIPTLLRLLRAKDSAFKIKVMGLLERQHVLKVENIPAEFWNLAASHGFEELGPNASSAVPELIRIANRNISTGPGGLSSSRSRPLVQQR